MDNVHTNIEYDLWIDMETTGLNADTCIPLEVGLRVVDRNDLISVTQKTWLIWEPGQDWSISMMEGAADKFVGPMHEKSGLWDDLLKERGKTTFTRASAEIDMIDWLAGQGFEKGTMPLHGSSIGSLDRPFVIKHFPEFNEFTNYRNIDVSTLKELCKRYAPGLYARLEEATGYDRDNKAHRVQEDIASSLAEYQFYVDNFLWCE